jgi:hypothetical protein
MLAFVADDRRISESLKQERAIGNRQEEVGGAFSRGWPIDETIERP